MKSNSGQASGLLLLTVASLLLGTGVLAGILIQSSIFDAENQEKNLPPVMRTPSNPVATQPLNGPIRIPAIKTTDHQQSSAKATSTTNNSAAQPTTVESTTTESAATANRAPLTEETSGATAPTTADTNSNANVDDTDTSTRNVAGEDGAAGSQGVLTDDATADANTQDTPAAAQTDNTAAVIPEPIPDITPHEQATTNTIPEPTETMVQDIPTVAVEAHHSDTEPVPAASPATTTAPTAESPPQRDMADAETTTTEPVPDADTAIIDSSDTADEIAELTAITTNTTPPPDTVMAEAETDTTVQTAQTTQLAALTETPEAETETDTTAQTAQTTQLAALTATPEAEAEAETETDTTAQTTQLAAPTETPEPPTEPAEPESLQMGWIYAGQFKDGVWLRVGISAPADQLPTTGNRYQLTWGANVRRAPPGRQRSEDGNNLAKNIAFLGVGSEILIHTVKDSGGTGHIWLEISY